MAPPQPRSWWSRHWKWVVPVGCLVPLLCCGSFTLATYLGASQLIAHSGAFTLAVARAQDDARVTARLGSPLSPGFGVQGEVKESNGRSVADFTLPITGPRGEGTLVVKAVGSGTAWTYSVLEVRVGAETFDLVPAATPALDALPAPDDDAPEPADPD